MATLLLIILVILFLLGYLRIPGLSISNIELFELFGHMITLYDILIFGAILWLIGILPSPFRQIAAVIFALWLLSFFGIIAITGFSNILVLVLIVGLILYVLKIF